MATCRYPLPYRYRRVRRYPYRFSSRKNESGMLPVVAVVGALLLAGAGAKAAVVHHAHKAPSLPSAGNPAAASVIAFARSKVGKVPYVYGGTTDAGMDCSGLAMEAYASAGITIERTSEQQWASERHVTTPVAGDLVFFAGSDGTPTAPGHVGIVTGKNTMIDEYETGTYARYDTFGLPSSAPGLGTVVGFTNPDPQAPASPSPAAAPGPGESGFIAAVLAGLGAPDTKANEGSFLGWFPREYPSWPAWAQWNPMSSTLPMPGSWAYNTLSGGLHVQNYPNAAEGAQATAATLNDGWYPAIVAALRSGSGICGGGFASELSTWSGGGYTEVC
jgi:cell wall-associated NlpC family hydrolase